MEYIAFLGNITTRFGRVIKPPRKFLGQKCIDCAVEEYCNFISKADIGNHDTVSKRSEGLVIHTLKISTNMSFILGRDIFKCSGRFRF